MTTMRAAVIHQADGRAPLRGVMMRFLLLAAALLAVSSAGAQTKANGGYTSAQALRGATVYTQSCMMCHGANLQGEAGPALAGEPFRLAYGGGTAAPLYIFISHQMPQDKPGSLSQRQYLEVTAYVLSRNGIAAGNTPLSIRSLGQVSLADLQEVTPQGNTNEIVRAAPPVRNVFAELPPGADVNITDSMMAAASSDRNDWLLHGRTYDNQRYSPLQQITADNVRSLAPVALVQTGMTASFETTPIVVNGVMYLTTPVVDRKMIIMAVNAATGGATLGGHLQSRRVPDLLWSGQPRRRGRLRQGLCRDAR